MQTTKEILAKAEFWAMTAMNEYDTSDNRHELLEQAYELVKKAGEIEEAEAWSRVLKAAQLG